MTQYSDGTPIARMVQEIVALNEAHEALDAAGAEEERLRKAFDKITAASGWLMTFEPHTADDTLSLLLVANEALGTVIDNHAETAIADHLRRVEGTLEAAVRGLARSGASSPLFERYTAPADRP